jgi:SAM-dependent methyltransferase
MRFSDQEPADVIREISPRDAMYGGDDAAYFESGRSALQCIELATLAIRRKPPSRILDLPCGHGRTLRMLKAAFPEAELIASDIDPDAVEFCSRVFGAKSVQSHFSPEQIELPGKVDLIWCGSLLTHLDSFRWNEFLAFFEQSLAKDGLLLFTTHGRLTADHLSTLTIRDFARPIENMIADYKSYGFAYSDYFDAPREYGVSLSSPTWVCGMLEGFPNLRLVSFTEAGWDSHQDVVACVQTQD